MRRPVLIAALLLLAQAPAHALIVDTFISGANYMKDEAYKAFMKLKVIEQIRIAKQNYDASMRYYREFERLNSGKGIFYNVGVQLKGAAIDMGRQLEEAVDRDFVHTYNTDTKVDRFFKSIDRGIAGHMKYAGDELGRVISDRKLGVDVAQSAQGLSPKDAANLSARAQGLQLQMLSQLHEDNLRLIELQSMQLAADIRRQESERRLISDIRKSVGKRVPAAAPREEDQ